MRRRLLSLTLTLATCCGAAAAEHAATVSVPAGTQIKMYVVGNVTPESTQPGDTFQAQAASDVVIDGLIVVRKGAEGQGTIADLKGARRGAGTNALALTIDWVFAADGSKLALSPSRQAQAAANPSGAAPKAPVPSTLAAFGIAGYFGIVNTFVKTGASVQTSLQPAP